MSELAATARSGIAPPTASRIASTAAVTLTTRPPHAAGGRGFNNEPVGKRTSTSAKRALVHRDGRVDEAADGEDHAGERPRVRTR